MDDDFEFPAANNDAEMAMDDDDMDPPVGNSILKVGEEKDIGNGLKKKLLKEGDGWEKPSSGDEVEGMLIHTLHMLCI